MSYEDSDSYNTCTDSENESEAQLVQHNSVDVWDLPSDLNTIRRGPIVKTHSMGYIHQQKQRRPNHFQPASLPSQSNNSSQPQLRTKHMPPLIQQSQTMSVQQRVASIQNINHSMSQRNLYQTQARNIQQSNGSMPSLLARDHNKHNSMNSKPNQNPFQLQQFQTMAVQQPLAPAQNINPSMSQRNIYQTQARNIQQSHGSMPSLLACDHNKHNSMNSKPNHNPFQMQPVQRNVYQSQARHIRQFNGSAPSLVVNRRNNNNKETYSNHTPSTFKANTPHDGFCNSPPAKTYSNKQPKSQVRHIRQFNGSAPLLVAKRLIVHKENNCHTPSTFKGNRAYDGFCNSPPAKVHNHQPPKVYSNKQPQSDVSAVRYSQQLLKCGFLEKQGGVVKSWKRRWFVLQINGLLSYYKNQNAKQPISVINCNEATALSQESFGGKSRTSFGIKLCTPKRNWKFVCKDKKERQEWFSTLQCIMSIKN